MKKIIISVAAVFILITGIGIGIYFSIVQKQDMGKTKEETTESIEEQKYNQAIDNLNKGYYEQAYEELGTLGSYRDAGVVKEQIIYESYVLSAMDSFKKKIDIDRSFNILKVTYWVKKSNTEKYPVILIQYSSDKIQNEKINYGYFLFNKKKEQYRFIDSVPTLDMNQLDRYDKEYVANTLTILEIEKLRKKRKTVGQVDTNRINQVIANEGYHNVRILKRK